MDGYDFTAGDFPQLLIRKFYPEKTDHESAVIRDYLLKHLGDFDRVSFSVRLGASIAPNPEHLPGVQRSTVFSSKRKIDLVAYTGEQPYLIEAKKRLTHAVLGQLLSDRQLFLEENPDAPEPRLVAIGRESDPDIERILTTNGIDVHVFEETHVE